MSIVVRPYQPKDQLGIEWLYSRTPPWGRTYPRPQPVPDEIRRIAAAFERVLVAVEQDRAGEAVVGLTAVRNARSESDIPLPEAVEDLMPASRLHHVLVAPEHWRQGIGRRLTQAAITWSRDHVYRHVVLDTTADQRGAVEFYRALGFREVARTRFREWEIVWFALDL